MAVDPERLGKGQANPWIEIAAHAEGGESYEYSVLMTLLELEAPTLGHLYRVRADMENSLDELKNQWVWDGFMTRDLRRTQIMVRLNALICNWRSLFVRLLAPDTQGEARTSRPLMINGVRRVSRHSRQVTLLVMIAHSAAADLRVPPYTRG